MSLSVWDYIRQRARDALMAGFQDALDQIERQDQPQLIHAAARQMKKRLHESAALSGNGGPSGNGSNSQTPTPPDPKSSNAIPASQTSPPNSAPAPSGRTSGETSLNSHSEQSQRRGPGRPRKETHG